MSKKNRFVIVNTIDAPIRRHVAEWVDGVGYCYMSRAFRPELKQFDGMNPTTPTPIEDFGFDVHVGQLEVMFSPTRESTATYEDGKPRKWQDISIPFSLPRVTLTKKERSHERI